MLLFVVGDAPVELGIAVIGIAVIKLPSRRRSHRRRILRLLALTRSSCVRLGSRRKPGSRLANSTTSLRLAARLAAVLRNSSRRQSRPLTGVSWAGRRRQWDSSPSSRLARSCSSCSASFLAAAAAAAVVVFRLALTAEREKIALSDT